ncbi:uncharacterized protein N7498_002622 [Penicillium cinerascens]|uniref:Uncharacterized protein n=1 Tax=Penicillium cinerascens TaxID=70096 RepID=A0A9W9TC42_9EURO|nr:uncharacterized protein N7498_002622 [Penicillium cinerascens]KAJ5216215.1 hypothetical protein N7498_002622 [Penicillium cinerascens]
MSLNESPRIPDHRLDNNASIRSSYSSSYSTVQPSIRGPPPQIRRVKTVSQLTRWVSKRMSRSSLDVIASGNELSKKNLNDLNLATTMSVGDLAEAHGSLNSVKPLLPTAPAKTIDTIQNSSAETSSEQSPENAREILLRKSYAAFCEEFTLSGPQRPKRKFDISMGIGETDEAYTNDAQPRIDTTMDSPGDRTVVEDKAIDYKAPNGSAEGSATLYESNFLTDEDIPSILYPQPPPQIMTPRVYQEMQRATRERQLARRQRILGPLRSLFSERQSLPGHQLDMKNHDS